MIIPAALTRVGVFTYYKNDGTRVRELRHPDEVFDRASMATLKSATVTVGHPGLVTPANFRQVSVGHVEEEGRQDGDFVAAPLRVNDAGTMADVRDKKLVELSCGYTCKLDATPGTYKGQDYDVVQRGITYNHVALLPSGGGRAGADVRLRLDSNSNQIEDEPASVPHAGDQVNGGPGTLIANPATDPHQDHTMDLAQALAKITELEGKLSAETARADGAVEKLNAASARLDSVDAKDAQVEVLKGQRDALQVKLDAAMAPDFVDARVNARVELVALAHAHLDSKDAAYSSKGKSDHQVRVDILAKLAPSYKADGKSEAAVAGAFEMAVETTGEARAAFARVIEQKPAGKPSERQDANSSYIKNVEASQKAHEVATPSRISAKA